MSRLSNLRLAWARGAERARAFRGAFEHFYESRGAKEGGERDVKTLEPETFKGDLDDLDLLFAWICKQCMQRA